MWELQFFVNGKLKLVPEVPSLEDYINRYDTAEKKIVRDAIFENIHLIDEFIDENPAAAKGDELDIVAGWKYFVGGAFFIERMLKKHAIFIQDNDVYAVLSLMDPLNEMIHKSFLPYHAKAVLLPFKGKIIYDGVLQGYNIYFGGGVKRRLKETYMAAKQAGRIVHSLGPEAASAPAETGKKAKPRKNWTPTLNKLMKEAKPLRGGAGQPAINSPAFSMIKASIEFGQAALADPDDLDGLWDCYNKVARSLKKAYRTIERAEMYRD